MLLFVLTVTAVPSTFTGRSISIWQSVTPMSISSPPAEELYSRSESLRRCHSIVVPKLFASSCHSVKFCNAPSPSLFSSVKPMRPGSPMMNGAGRAMRLYWRLRFAASRPGPQEMMKAPFPSASGGFAMSILAAGMLHQLFRIFASPCKLKNGDSQVPTLKTEASHCTGMTRRLTNGKKKLF